MEKVHQFEFEKGNRFLVRKIMNLKRLMHIQKKFISFEKSHEFEKIVQICKKKFMNKNRPKMKERKRVKLKKTGQTKGNPRLIFSGLQVDAQTKTKNVW